jgi:hypothetical protein
VHCMHAQAHTTMLVQHSTCLPYAASTIDAETQMSRQTYALSCSGWTTKPMYHRLQASHY